MPKRTKREPKPAKSNRGLGRPNARGVFVIFDELQRPEPELHGEAEDEPLAREEDAGEQDGGGHHRLHLASGRDGLRVTFRPTDA